jgi:hypothetical protein
MDIGYVAGEDRGHVVQHVGGGLLVVAEVADQACLDHVDLLLGVLVDHARDERGELDRVLLILEQLQLQGLVQALVGAVVEGLALDRERTDVVHDLAAEVVLARLGDVDLLLDRAHQPLVRLLVLAGVAVAHLLALGVGLDVVDVVAAEPLDRLLVGGDRALHLVLDDLGVLLAHDRQQVAVALAVVLGRDQGVVLQAALQLVDHHEGVDVALLLVGHEGVRDLVLDVAGGDALHALAHRLLAQLLDVVLGEAGQALAVVELELLEQGEVGLLGVLQAREHGPHRGDLQGVGGDMDAHLLLVEVALVDPLLVLQAGDIGDVDADGAVLEGLHELVVL